MHSKGIGVGYSLRYHNLILSLKNKIKYVEIAPEDFFRNYNHDKLQDIKTNFAIAIHGRSLNFAATIGFDGDYIENFQDVIRKTDPFLVSDHMSLFSEGDYDIDLYIPPIYSKENAKRLVKKMMLLKDLMPHCSLGMENVPNFIFNNVNTMNEGEFFQYFCEESGVGVVLNLDSIFISAYFQNIDPIVLIKSYPKKWIHCITYLPAAAMNKIIAKKFGSQFENQVDISLKEAVAHSECKNVLLQFGHFDGDDQEVGPLLEKLQTLAEIQ